MNPVAGYIPHPSPLTHSLPSYWINGPNNKRRGNCNQNWRQFFYCHNIQIYSASINTVIVSDYSWTQTIDKFQLLEVKSFASILFFFILSILSGQAGILNCKLHWYPKIYNTKLWIRLSNYCLYNQMFSVHTFNQ